MEEYYEGSIAHAVFNALSFRTARFLVWAGLKWQDDAIKLNDAGDKMDAYFAEGGSMTSLIKEAFEALAEAGIEFAEAGAEGNVKVPVDQISG